MAIDTTSTSSIGEENAQEVSRRSDTTIGLASAMQDSLNGLETSLKIFNEQSGAYTTRIDMNTDRTAEMQDLQSRLRAHYKAQNSLIAGAKKTIRHDLKDTITNCLREDFSARIKSEIVLQVKDQVDIQIQEYVPVPLRQQVLDNKRQISEIKVSLFNSEARARNSALETTNLDEHLMPILKVDGTRSKLYPADLRSLFSYDSEMVKELVEDFNMEADYGSLQVNFGRFMRHIGIQNVRAVAEGE